MRFSEILSIIDSAGTLVLGFVAFMVWKIKTNDLPHLEGWIRDISERLARHEGREDVRREDLRARGFDGLD